MSLLTALSRPLMVVLVAAVATACLSVLAATTGSAQLPATEEQAIAIERQLLCPQCTNKRLDVCELAICYDMKQLIRERLEAGSTADDIILFFETRYGPQVRAELPREGFNLWLFGWVTGALALVALAGGWFLLSLRSRARPAPAATAPVDDDWLDAELRAAEERDA
ncbi:MAG: cytochrome c-type biogenesis protein CcmH [Chloroflexi bacterium]|nr:cytochrome c-type biogenesis protein CcmH [Chloroflexota bacterium]MDA1240055.1 cytochrome c-type biogenesis protein CcmH [Chloroflexota bacterium]MQC48123.1 cytochrome c-type biogenesis protein CcmH [Chloroflexota bacterium]